MVSRILILLTVEKSTFLPRSMQSALTAMHLHTCEQATLISSLSPRLIHAWVVNVAELVTRDQLDIDILRHGREGDLQPADGGRVVVVLDITGPAPGVYF